MTTIIDGKAVAADMRGELAKEIDRLEKEYNERPGLSVILVGHDPASEVYVRLKEKACKEIGILSHQHNLPEDTTQAELLALIDRLNADPTVNGILVQLPLPRQLDTDAILDRIDPAKDVDGFHPVNVGLLSQQKAALAPCTPAGCMELLDRYNIAIEGAHAVVLGRSNIVGKPLAMMLLHRNATVTICHSKTKDLAKVVSNADIVLAAIGKPNFVTAEMVREGAAVIDVGISRVEGKLVGDVDYEAVAPKASHITPVPGGVGPMTIAMLLANTVTAFKAQRGVSP